MNYCDKFYGSYNELGGFAEDESVIDGGYKEYVAFNWCLAMDYYTAMYLEDFYQLGYVDKFLINDIMTWINYDGEINKDMEEEIKKIPTGMITTCNNRPFIDAVIESNRADLACTFISYGNKDTRLLLTYMLYGDNDNYNVINWYVSIQHCNNKESYIIQMKRIFSAIDNYYNGIKENEDKIKFLEIIKKNIQNVRYPKEYGKISTEDIGDYNFVRKLVR